MSRTLREPGVSACKLRLYEPRPLNRTSSLQEELTAIPFYCSQVERIPMIIFYCHSFCLLNRALCTTYSLLPQIQSQRRSNISGRRDLATRHPTHLKPNFIITIDFLNNKSFPKDYALLNAQSVLYYYLPTSTLNLKLFFIEPFFMLSDSVGWICKGFVRMFSVPRSYRMHFDMRGGLFYSPNVH